LKPACFEYHAPATIEEALYLLGEHGDEAKVLAGGQSLIPMLAMRLTRFDHLIDINRVPQLAGVDKHEDVLRVAATTRQAVMDQNRDVAEFAPLLARAAPLIAHFQIRNRGTVGGSIAHGDPASELPAVALALRARMQVANRNGHRWVSALDFFKSTWEVDVRADEMLVAMEFPHWQGRAGFAIEEVARRHGDFALAGVACALALDDSDVVTRAGIGMFGVASTPVVAARAEESLLGSRADTIDLAEVGQIAVSELEPPEDLHASSRYRRHVTTHLTVAALGTALKEAKGVR
jgi:carbon-monoxide dehydrogenase medium subunit